MEKQPFEDVSPTKNGDLTLSCWFSGVLSELLILFLMQLLMNFEVEPGQLKGIKLATKLDMKEFS